MSRGRRALLAAAALGLAACAGAPPAEDAAKKVKPIGSYAADPFVPINLYMNANEQLSGMHETLVEYAAARLHDSDAFVRVDRGVQRWPITLQARYQFREEPATVRRVLGWLTLRLVPIHVEQTHALTAEVLAEPESVGTLELTITVQDRVSLYDRGDPARGERAAADVLLDRLMAEIAQRKLVPRWSAFKPAEPPPKKKPRPEGRPT